MNFRIDGDIEKQKRSSRSTYVQELTADKAYASSCAAEAIASLLVEQQCKGSDGKRDDGERHEKGS